MEKKGQKLASHHICTQANSRKASRVNLAHTCLDFCLSSCRYSVSNPENEIHTLPDSNLKHSPIVLHHQKFLAKALPIPLEIHQSRGGDTSVFRDGELRRREQILPSHQILPQTADEQTEALPL